MIFTENKTHFVLCMKGMNLNWILWISVLSHFRIYHRFVCGQHQNKMRESPWNMCEHLHYE